MSSQRKNKDGTISTSLSFNKVGHKTFHKSFLDYNEAIEFNKKWHPVYKQNPEMFIEKYKEAMERKKYIVDGIKNVDLANEIKAKIKVAYQSGYQAGLKSKPRKKTSNE